MHPMHPSFLPPSARTSSSLLHFFSPRASSPVPPLTFSIAAAVPAPPPVPCRPQRRPSPHSARLPHHLSGEPPPRTMAALTCAVAMRRLPVSAARPGVAPPAVQHHAGPPCSTAPPPLLRPCLAGQHPPLSPLLPTKLRRTPHLVAASPSSSL
ncbi:hypothetical protein GUJ93_ZPchr0006g41747 [Zizania palustris]|uniref:Uncharacterized protein n=1 Tax=Zizania palustris TaxID=103762 RepID=A0A8J5SWK7_ZIZPA|nr:hypothetical protein GUJ93_ZPchr0006g41747 [Zizania palustris]